MIQILLFGPVAELAGTRKLTLDYLPGMTLGDALAQFHVRHPQAAAAISFTAINETQVRDRQHPLADRDTLAFMAGFSGG